MTIDVDMQVSALTFGVVILHIKDSLWFFKSDVGMYI